MAFASKYLSKNKIYDDHITTSPGKNLEYIIVIPAYNEDQISKTLHSLNRARKPEKEVEIIIVVNSSEQSGQTLIEQNRRTISEIDDWKTEHPESFLKIFVIEKLNLPHKYLGAGYARKIGMDEAIARFNQIDHKDGFIISLDADTLVDENYFQAIENHTEKNPEINAGIFYFEHPTSGTEFNPGIYNGIIHYELYLRYYKNALRYTGFPYAFYTIGSAFMVKAEAYIKQGGMNRRQAGEDFYFLNKIFQLGQINEINATRVIPSPRPSDRVIFGTGPEIKKRIQQKSDYKDTYDLQAFEVLKNFFAQITQLFKGSPPEVESFIYQQNKTLQDFLLKEKFPDAINRINNNCKNKNIFLKHFYHWFDGLKIFRFLRISHEKDFSKQTLKSVAGRLLKKYGIECTKDPEYEILLNKFRDLDRSKYHSIHFSTR